MNIVKKLIKNMIIFIKLQFFNDILFNFRIFPKLIIYDRFQILYFKIMK